MTIGFQGLQPAIWLAISLPAWSNGWWVYQTKPEFTSSCASLSSFMDSPE
jgi:hypothetical protein